MFFQTFSFPNNSKNQTIDENFIIKFIICLFSTKIKTKKKKSNRILKNENKINYTQLPLKSH